MNRSTPALLSLAGGLMCGLAWTGWCSGLILLVALVPFLILEQLMWEYRGRYGRNSFLLYLLPGMVLFCMVAIGWMRVASLTGAIVVITGLAVLMSLTMHLAHIIRLRAGRATGYISLITLWMSFELLSLNATIISPWLNLGNGLSKDILFIQWYEVTGTAGGTLWILVSNIFITLALTGFAEGKTEGRKYLGFSLLVMIVPVIVSVQRYRNLEPDGTQSCKVLIIQPDIDPFTEKFTIPFEEQLDRVIRMAAGSITPGTQWIITPETTVDDPVNLDSVADNKYVIRLKHLAGQFPDAAVAAGLVSFRSYHGMKSPPTRSARETGIPGEYYDHYNSAFRLDTGSSFEVYHKSKLVPGIEMQFAGGPGRLISRILPYLGGTKWGYGIQTDRTCLTHKATGMKVAPIICYESVFGSFVRDYVKAGAEALFIMTNDGWWKGTSGYRQHLQYASLRAIETRRPVARAANTGVSCIIDIRGRRTAETGWWTPATLSGDIIPESRITPYVKYGDYLLWMAASFSLLIILKVFVADRLRYRR